MRMRYLIVVAQLTIDNLSHCRIKKMYSQELGPKDFGVIYRRMPDFSSRFDD